MSVFQGRVGAGNAFPYFQKVTVLNLGVPLPQEHTVGPLLASALPLGVPGLSDAV